MPSYKSKKRQGHLTNIETPLGTFFKKYESFDKFYSDFGAIQCIGYEMYRAGIRKYEDGNFEKKAEKLAKEASKGNKVSDETHKPVEAARKVPEIEFAHSEIKDAHSEIKDDNKVSISRTPTSYGFDNTSGLNFIVCVINNEKVMALPSTVHISVMPRHIVNKLRIKTNYSKGKLKMMTMLGETSSSVTEVVYMQNLKCIKKFKTLFYIEENYNDHFVLVRFRDWLM